MTRRSAPRPFWARFFGAVFYISVLLVVFLGASIAGWVNKSPVFAKMIGSVLHPQPPEEAFNGRNSITLLLLGCDVTIDEHTKKVLTDKARADMILVAKLDFANKSITGVSIPRDTQVALPGYRSKKINAYHAIGKGSEGADLTKAAVEQILPGVSIDRVVTLDYEAFQRMVDLVGGVTIDVPKPMSYDDNAGGLHIHLKRGVQKLNGYQAMGFVRFRHNDSDFARQDRQKEFLVSFKQAMLSPGNLGKLPAVVTEAMSVMGNALTVDEVASLAMFAKGVPQTNIKMGQIPVRPGRGTNLLVDDRKIMRTLQEYGLAGTAQG